MTPFLLATILYKLGTQQSVSSNSVEIFEKLDEQETLALNEIYLETIEEMEIQNRKVSSLDQVEMQFVQATIERNWALVSATL